LLFRLSGVIFEENFALPENAQDGQPLLGNDVLLMLSERFAMKSGGAF
jgi:hypothetical protein